MQRFIGSDSMAVPGLLGDLYSASGGQRKSANCILSTAIAALLGSSVVVPALGQTAALDALRAGALHYANERYVPAAVEYRKALAVCDGSLLAPVLLWLGLAEAGYGAWDSSSLHVRAACERDSAAVGKLLRVDRLRMSAWRSLTKRAFKASGSGEPDTARVYAALAWQVDPVRSDNDSLTRLFSSMVGSGETPTRRRSSGGEIQKRVSGQLPPVIEVDTVFFADQGNRDGVLDAMESVEVTLTVRNRGKGDAQDLSVLVSPTENYKDLKYQAETKVPLVKRGDSVTVRIPVSAGEQVETQTVKLRIDVKEPYFGADADPKVLSFSTRRLAPPDLTVAGTGVDDDEEGESMGNSNGTIEPGETFELTAVIQNKGTGKAENVRVTFREPLDKNVMFVGTSDTVLGAIGAGEWKKVIVPVYVNKRIEQQSFRLPLAIAESRPRFNRADTISLSLNKQMKRPDEISVAMVVTEEKADAEPVPELTADVDVNIPSTGASNPTAVAVIVAGYEYARAPKVDYAARDGAVLKQYLLKTLGFKEENIIHLRSPGKADFEWVFGIKGNAQGQLHNYVRKGESDVFVYYTGHGAPDLKTKEAYLVPTDAQPSYIDLQGYPLSTLYENLAQIPAKSITVVLDACFSGAYDKGLIVQQASPLVVAAAPEPGKLPENMTLMTSAGASEVSSWYADKKHSLFTYWFLKGLQGAADANKDKSITLGEMKAYLSENVSYWAQRLHNRIQTPTFSGDESRVLARLK